jgi:two-component system, chemotaxis family, CheB/CheR fusion protein
VGSLKEEPVLREGMRPRRVLLVDDVADGREALARWLELLGHEVRTAADGWLALQLAASFQPHIIFLDIGMPGMDGYELCSRLRAQVSGVHASIYALTGFSSEQHRARSLRAGFDGYLVKPIDLHAIDELIAAGSGTGSDAS